MAKAKTKAKTTGKPNPKPKATAKAKAPTEVVLVASKIKSAIKDAGCNTAGDALDGLNAYVMWLVQQATARATHNGRKTVRAHDFMIG